jgi:hypothetical protein
MGRMVKLATAGAASPLGIRAATAMPRAQKQAAPSSRVTTAAGSIRQTTWTSNRTTPTATMTIAPTTENQIEDRIRAAT